MKSRGFVVHCYADSLKDRLYLLGRLEDGRSFAARGKWRPSFHIYKKEKKLADRVLSSLKYEAGPPELEAFDGREELIQLTFSRYRDYSAAGRLLEQSGISSPDGDLKPPEAYCVRQHLRGPAELEGETRPGRLVDLVFPDPEIHPLDINPMDEFKVGLRIASADIETDVEQGTILAAAISLNAGVSNLVPWESTVYVLHDETANMPHCAHNGRIFFYPSEASLLEAFIENIRRSDPDIITGWNFLDFDYPRLAERCAFHHIPFNLGRSAEESKFFPSYLDESGRGDTGRRRRSAAALVQGRQVLDALRIFRSSPRAGGGGRWDSSSYSLESVAGSVLGKGKLLAGAASMSGAQKIAALKELYLNDPAAFGEYCMHDAELVLGILEKTGLFRLTMERAILTGVSLDKAWTSVVSFERIYGIELHRRLIAPVALDPRRQVSGAAGGTVLEPMPGLFPNVAVFDFRSLYPTIMRTFNIDPLAHARSGAGGRPGGEGETAERGTDAEAEELIIAPNGAVFSREKGILSEIIAGYFAARRRAMDAGDEEASYVYKILMNSFYGVLGTSSCRYGLSELAGAITSFARKWLMFSQEWFCQKGYRVLYGDTDSLFVETGLGDGAGYETFLSWGKNCSQEINAAIRERIRAEYRLESFLELRFEKPYRRFMIPPLRGASGNGRGRAKGYGGFLLDSEGGLSVEVKGMEAVRSDYTPLARRIQLELLELVFYGGSEENFKSRVHGILRELRQGNLDAELVYRKRLARAPETYTASTPPQVKAARALGWKNRRGTVEYVWTVNGPEPWADEDRQALPHAALDYDHYAESQVLPAARSIAAAAGWKDDFPSPGQDYFRYGQAELW